MIAPRNARETFFVPSLIIDILSIIHRLFSEDNWRIFPCLGVSGRLLLCVHGQRKLFTSAESSLWLFLTIFFAIFAHWSIVGPFPTISVAFGHLAKSWRFCAFLAIFFKHFWPISGHLQPIWLPCPHLCHLGGGAPFVKAASPMHQKTKSLNIRKRIQGKK